VTVGAAASGQLYAEALGCTGRSGVLAVSSVAHDKAGFAAQVGDIAAARAHLEAEIKAARAIGQQPSWRR
jgi:hypothetical protein